MPRKRRAPKTRTPRVSRRLVAYLLSGEWKATDVLSRVTVDVELDDSPTDRVTLFEFLLRRQKLAPWWVSLREPLVNGWVRTFPGTRPWAWWEFDAPRWRRENMPPNQQRLPDHLREPLAEPRRRLGGTGDPVFEHFNSIPSLWNGIPQQFFDAWDVEYYSGRAMDIHGQPIGTAHMDGAFQATALDPDDPPVYESEAAYLKRHGLFVEGERERLPDDAFEPTIVVAAKGEDTADRVPAA